MKITPAKLRTPEEQKAWLEWMQKLTRGNSGEPAPKRERVCGGCGCPLTGRQKTACSNRCHVALHRKHRREGALPKGGKIGPQTPLPITPMDDASRETASKTCRDALRKLAGGSGDCRAGEADM